MNKAEIKKLLHHREPYLMVSEVLSLNEREIEVIKVHEGDEAHLKGHFPGAPVVPGAMLQEICTQAAGIILTKYHCPVKDYDSETTKGHALGVLNKIEGAKFVGIVKPGKEIKAKVVLKENFENLFKFEARISQDNETKAKFKFNLMNISDEYIL